jgi:hypothetical protein
MNSAHTSKLLRSPSPTAVRGRRAKARMDVHPAVDGYYIQFDNSDSWCGITHREVFVRAALNDKDK